MQEATGVQQYPLKVEDVAKQLNCSKSYVYKLYKDNIIRGFRLGRCFIRFEQCEVDRVKKSWQDITYKDIDTIEYKNKK